ncbi:DUF2279 domain-containing protein [Anaerobaca lacustris]|uniref:DUF2279 domain-containing protein n=1 Tax=Anaerobaca lacustris TaxID=3044600 RepID=A0AAW6U2X3_9BACT|nr:DUF2279 domain-containing protein [Sedimentisphaerales bacterium M17dextr]
MVASFSTTRHGTPPARRRALAVILLLTFVLPARAQHPVSPWPELWPNGAPTPDAANGIEDSSSWPFTTDPEADSFWTRRRKVLALNVGGAAAILGFGSIAWKHGSSGFTFQDEGWFERDTKYGGADKLGHAWANYALAMLYSQLYASWDFEPREAALYGTLTSWAHTTLVEIGDGFSKDHGFSWEDLLFNTCGAALAYARQLSPSLAESVDFRLEWIPSRQFLRGDRLDPFTDYSGHKYLLALKLGGLLKSDDPMMRALEVHVGYYTRGYVSGDDRYFRRETRHGYVGLGLNVTYMLDRLTGQKAWNLFDYVQMPYTYLPAQHSFD